jgi:hypothetical protein
VKALKETEADSALHSDSVTQTSWEGPATMQWSMHPLCLSLSQSWPIWTRLYLMHSNPMIRPLQSKGTFRQREAKSLLWQTGQNQQISKLGLVWKKVSGCLFHKNHNYQYSNYLPILGSCQNSVQAVVWTANFLWSLNSDSHLILQCCCITKRSNLNRCIFFFI